MEIKDKYLTQDGNNYIINSKIPFGSRTKADCSSEDLEKALKFSYNMTFGTKGEHRSNRAGGILNRNLSQQFVDILIGKLGEIAFFNVCKQRRAVVSITKVDYECYRLGVWDNSDFTINHKYNIAVKTTKHFGNLLLLEEKDWVVNDCKAVYIPNTQALCKGIYDFLFFSRVKINIQELIRGKFIESWQITDFINLIRFIAIELEVVGYISNTSIARVIQNNFLLPQGAMLNGTTRMDASNYYLQSGFFVR